MLHKHICPLPDGMNPYNEPPNFPCSIAMLAQQTSANNGASPEFDLQGNYNDFILLLNYCVVFLKTGL